MLLGPPRDKRKKGRLKRRETDQINKSNNLNKICNVECNKGNKYLCNRFLTNNPDKYIAHKVIDCSKYDIEGYMLKSCKPYIQDENQTKCLNDIYYQKNTFNKNNLLLRGEKECNKKGLGVKKYHSCPYDNTKLLFECDKNYMNGEPIENNKQLHFINHY